MMNERIRTLMDKRDKALVDARAIANKAFEEARDMTAEEKSQYAAFDKEYDNLSEAIVREETLAKREALQASSANGERNPQRGRQPVGVESREGAINESAEYRRDMLGYLINGQVGGNLVLDGMGEKRAILGVSLTGNGATGGVLAPVQLEKSLLEDVANVNVMRKLADVRSSATDVDIPYVTTHTSAYLVAEGADFTASTPAFDKVTMTAHKVGALSYVTVEAMQDMFIDMESWIRDDFARAFGDLEETHFISGTGSGQPEGILTGGTSGKVAASQSAVTTDEILDLIYAVPGKYRKNGAFLLHDTTVKLLRKLKDGEGRYLWQPSIKEGEPDKLLGYSLYTSDSMPQVAAGAKAIVFGDFKKFRVLDRKGLYFQRLNEIAATSGQVAFLAYRRYDSKVLDNTAIKFLSMASGS